MNFNYGLTTSSYIFHILFQVVLVYGTRISASTSGAGKLFLAYGTRISASTTGAGKCHLTPPM